jgi:hypothetical protein
VLILVTEVGVRVTGALPPFCDLAAASLIGRSQVSHGVGGDDEPRTRQPGSGGRAELGRANMKGSGYFYYRSPATDRAPAERPLVSRDFETEFTRRELKAYFARWRPAFAGAGLHNRVNSRVARSYVAKSFTALATTNAPVIVASNCEASSDERPSSTSFS